MAPSSAAERAQSRRRQQALRGRIAILAAVLGVPLIAAAVAFAVAWPYASSVVVPDHSPYPEDITVKAVRPGRIVLERTEQTARPGVFGLSWQGGHAKVGRPLAEDEQTVTRRLLGVDGYLVSGSEVALDDVYVGNPGQALGLPFYNVEIDGELGPMPAWLVPPKRSEGSIPHQPPTWAIYVHGINGTRQSGIAIAPLLRRLGLTGLYISYRDDLGAPESPDGYHHMGLTEWRDLQAAARYALSHGARRLVLYGVSMGGSIVARFMELSPLAGRVSALILDSPALDWKRILEFNATEMGLPGFAALPVEWAVGVRIDADWNGVDTLSQTGRFHLPILLFHGLADDLIPIQTSDEFASKLRRWVTYYRVPEAEHAQSWNVAPALYERRVASFLSGLPYR